MTNNFNPFPTRINTNAVLCVRCRGFCTLVLFIAAGLGKLVEQVRQAAEKVLLSYSLKHQLTAEGVGQLLNDIRSLSSSSCSRPSTR